MACGLRNPQRRGQTPWRARVARNLRKTLPQLLHSSIFWGVCTHAAGRQVWRTHAVVMPPLALGPHPLDGASIWRQTSSNRRLTNILCAASM